MTIDEFLIDYLDEQVYAEPNFRFWVQTVVDATALLGPDTDSDLERLILRLLDYHAWAEIDPEEIDGIRHEIVRLRGVAFWGDATIIALKYRVLNAIASSRGYNLAAGCANFQYGIVTAFQNTNYHGDKDQALIALIQSNAARDKIELFVNKNSETVVSAEV